MPNHCLCSLGVKGKMEVPVNVWAKSGSIRVVVLLVVGEACREDLAMGEGANT